MIGIRDITAAGFAEAIHGMRLAYGEKSLAKADSSFDNGGAWHMGEKDLKLAQSLIRRGSEHRKFLRAVPIWVKDLTAPIAWWKQFDTYKVGTVSLSGSTMHCVMDKEFEVSDFDTDGMTGDAVAFLEGVCGVLNARRRLYLTTKDKMYWEDVIRILPESYLQTRTVMLNYEVALSIIHQRSGHKLEEWDSFIALLKTLPYMQEFLEATKPAGKWRNIDFMLPDDGEEVLAYDCDGDVRVARFHGMTWFNYDGDIIEDRIVKWAEIPEDD